jgi:hypothetical protein
MNRLLFPLPNYRVGRYADAAAANVQAVKADRAYFTKAEPSDIYRMMYYPHNLDFIWHAASMEGRSGDTVRAAREFAAAAPTEVILQMSDMETAPAAPILALARFGRWDEILREPAPPAGMPYVTGAWRYSRGVAFAATGRPQDAARELARRGYSIAKADANPPAGVMLTGTLRRFSRQQDDLLHVWLELELVESASGQVLWQGVARRPVPVPGAITLAEVAQDSAPRIFAEAFASR